VGGEKEGRGRRERVGERVGKGGERGREGKWEGGRRRRQSKREASVTARAKYGHVLVRVLQQPEANTG